MKAEVSGIEGHEKNTGQKEIYVPLFKHARIFVLNI
jgi:hypothetical protein